MLDRRWRHGVERGLGPLGRGLRRIGVPADALTVFGLLASVVDRVPHRLGPLRLGRRRRHRGRRQRPPRRRDRAGQRSGEPARRVLRLRHRPRLRRAAARRRAPGTSSAPSHPYNAILAFAVAACSMLVSYERARAEALGLDARGGLMERAERFVFLGIALAFNILVPVLWIMLVLTAATAVYRFVHGVPPGRPSAAVHARREQRLLRRKETLADPRRPAPLRTWWTTRRMEGDRTRRRHPSVRRNSRP